MYRQYKRALIAILGMLLLVSLTGCSSKPKSKKDVMNEITQVDSYFSRYGLSVNEFTIDKRQTNENDKTDFVWVSISGENDDFSYQAEYEITYVLYNDGWRLEDYSLLDANCTVAKEFDRTDLETELASSYDSYSYSDMTSYGNDTTVRYEVTKRDNYILSTYDIEIDYSYAPETSWVETDRRIKTVDEDLDIVGEWIYTNNVDCYFYGSVPYFV